MNGQIYTTTTLLWARKHAGTHPIWAREDPTSGLDIWKRETAVVSAESRTAARPTRNIVCRLPSVGLLCTRVWADNNNTCNKRSMILLTDNIEKRSAEGFVIQLFKAFC
jgi:hypothetical protein